VIPLTMPPLFDPGFEAPFDQESLVFPLLPGWRNDDAGPVEVAGPTGATVVTSAGSSVTVNPEDLASTFTINLAPVPSPAGESCFQGNGSVGQFRVALPQTVSGGVVAADVLFDARQSFSMVPISVDDKSQVLVGTNPQTVPKGNSRVFAVLPGTSVSIVGFGTISPRSHFCIAGLQVGSILEHTQGTTCQEINVFGDPSTATDCGTPWLQKTSSAQS
jgi:hypothetical protein